MKRKTFLESETKSFKVWLDEDINNPSGVETSYDLDHRHRYAVNENGDGQTLNVLPEHYAMHKHNIINWIVQESDYHAHTIYNAGRIAIE